MFSQSKLADEMLRKKPKEEKGREKNQQLVILQHKGGKRGRAASLAECSSKNPPKKLFCHHLEGSLINTLYVFIFILCYSAG